MKKTIHWQRYAGLAFFVLVGAACGFLMAGHLDFIFPVGGTFGELLFSLALLFVGLYAVIFLQIVIHEAGHLIFGLLTGYRYASFRIGSLMWVKEDGRLTLKRLSIGGTGGQCLMIPPEISDGTMPFVLYNLGGPLINLVSGLIFLGLYFLYSSVPYLSVFLLMLSLIGFVYALTNGIPMRLGTVNNDGHNALSLGKNGEALRSFWVQLKVTEQLSKGVRLKDMPEEWFCVPSPEGMKNSMTAVMGVFACNRLMDAHSFEDADQLMDRLLQADSAIIDLHRHLMLCDRVYCALLGKARQELVETMLDKRQKSFMSSMKNYLSVLRTEYAYALLAEKDREKAAKIRAQFEKRAHTAPYPGDIEGERALIAAVDLAAERSDT